jgi:protein ImuA
MYPLGTVLVMFYTLNRQEHTKNIHTPCTAMTPSAGFSGMRNRSAVAQELRRLLPKMEGFSAGQILPFGLSAIDRYLPQGGLPRGALHEIVPEESSTPAAFGFILALLARISSPPTTSMPAGARKRGPGGREKFFLIMPAYGLREYGRPHGHGCNALGLDPGRLILAETRHRNETLWAMEEALRSGAPAAVAGVIDKLDLKLSQRLHLAAVEAGLPLFLLRQAQFLESSAAATRWRVAPAPAARDRFGLFARPRWHLRLERCRNGRAGEWIVEYDHVAHRFSLAAALADPAHSRRANGETRRQAG